MKVDWAALTRAVTPKHGDARRLALEMEASGLTVKSRAFYRWRCGVQIPSADFAVWLYEKAKQTGVEIPRKT